MATLRNMFHDIAEAIRSKGITGTFKPTEMATKIGEIRSLDGYGYLTFTAEQATTLTLRQSRNIAPHKLLKSTDGVNWTKWENPSTNGISLNAGQSVYLKADEDALWRTTTGSIIYNNFYSTGKIKCDGDIRSILKFVVPGDYSYWVSNLFNGCTSLTQAPVLPATTLAANCYYYMFDGCKSLKRIKMNASSGSLVAYMFRGCTSLELVDMTGSTGVPTLSNVNNFQNTNDTYKIVVPDSLYDTWITATNWASIASHIMKQSDWNSAHPDDILG